MFTSNREQLLTYILLIFFCILWGIWLLPHTVFVRHTAMILGASLGLYVCIKYCQFIINRENIPLLAIFFLLVWVTIHYLFIGIDNDLQRNEYFGVWKKVLLSIPFAIGLGLLVGKNNNKKFWNIFYFGLSLPVLIYFFKWVISYNANLWNVENPHFLLNSDHMNHRFGVSRALYPFFCLPAYFSGLIMFLKSNLKLSRINLFYLIIIVLTPLLFFLEGDRTGLFLSALFCLYAIFKYIKNNTQRKKYSFFFGNCPFFGICVNYYWIC